MASATTLLPIPSPFDRVADASMLRAAWAHVRRAAERSSSRAVRVDARAFDDDVDRRLERLAADVRAQRFTFAPARGIKLARPGRRPRPIVIAPLESRVVSRALLDVLQTTPSVRASLSAPTSFGGLPGRGVEQAIGAAIDAIDSGAVFYLRSDIADFFRKIPRAHALAVIAREIDDPRFIALLDRATRVEIDDLASHGDAASLFPSADVGVAQGCSLSTLLGNALLSRFDATLNGRGITCLRYVDDLLLLGPRPSHVKKAFASAERILAELGLAAYHPACDPAKAAEGHAAGGVEWLGCEIARGRARPSAKSRRALVARVAGILDASEPTVGGAGSALAAVEDVLAGFRGAYEFCASQEVFASLDAQIGRCIERYLRANRPRLVAPRASQTAS